MKKFLIQVLSLTLMLTVLLSAPVIANAAFINLGVNITNDTDKITVTVDNSDATNSVLAERQPSLTVDCSFNGARVMFGDEVVPSELQDGKITFTVTKGGDYTITSFLSLEDEELLNQDEVWINGLPYEVKLDGEKRYVEGVSDGDCIMVTYSYHAGEAGDVHTQYPTGMKAYRVTDGKITYIPELDDLLQYSGSSIRITGNKGIRMITSLTKDAKAKLTSSGLADYKLLEYGTVLCWKDDIPAGDALVLGRPFARSNYAYKRGVADPVFANVGNLTQYTNVLVGFTDEQCKDDIAMRPYIIIEDAAGEAFTLYGGTVYRSIGYIAYQNRNAFTAGSDAYNYVWDIIHNVYGNEYDAEYKGK